MLDPSQVDAIRHELGLDAAEITTRKTYLEFTETDIVLLKQVHAHLHEHRSELAAAFYDHLGDVEALRHLIPNKDTLTRLKQAQSTYFDELTAGDYGAAYVDRRLRIGLVHQRIGLEPKWYIGAYRKFLAELTPTLWEVCDQNNERALATWNAVFKLVMFDMGLALDTYFAADTAKIRELKSYAEQIIGCMPSALLVLDANLQVRFANPAFRELFGLGLHEALDGLPVQTWLDQPALIERAHKAFAQGIHQHYIPIDVPIAERLHRLDIDISVTTLDEKKHVLLLLQDVTERVEAAQVLQESEQRFAATFNQAAVGIAHVGLDGLWLRVNRRLCDIVGYSEEELLQRTFQDITHPDDLETDLQHLHRLIAGEIPDYQLIKRYLHKDGHTVWINLTVALARDDENQPSYFISVIEDITARVKAETAFRAIVEATSAVTGRNFFRTLTRKLAEALDVKYAFIGRLTGPSDEQVSTEAIWAGSDFAAPLNYGLAGTPCEQVVDKTLCAYPCNVAVQFPDDTLLVQMGIESYIGVPVFDSQGQPLGLIAVMDDKPMTDTTLATSVLNILAARAGAELERQATNKILQLHDRALDASSNGIVIIDALQADMPIIYVNPAFERMTGYTAAEAIGRNCRFLQSGDRGQPEIAILAAALREHTDAHVVLRNYRKDGQRFWNEVSISPVRDAAGEVTHFIGIQTDVSERKQQESHIAHLATHDGMTGLPNRNLLQDRVEQAMAHAERDQHNVALLMVDLDRFKNINESLGHAHGDKLLITIADRLRDTLDEGDTVAHLGADHYVILLAGVDIPAQITDAIESILRTISTPVDLDGHELVMSAGVGVSVYPQDGQDFGTLLKNADTARYRAKDLGQNRFQFYAEAMNAKALARLTLEGALHHAIERNELLLHYQPQVDLISGDIIGLEALIRWQRPGHGMVSPVDFIPLAEESGLIVPIGEWVLRTACTQTRAWHAAGYKQLRIAVNLSPRQFREPDLEGMVRNVLAETGLDPIYLELEITESSLMENAERAVATLQALNKLGAQIAIDDFGTGYSSLSYLKRFPIDVVKIDRSFVNEVTTDPDDAAIARSIIALAHSMKLKVVAEGIETEAQLAFLTSNRCDMMQGYYFSRPLPVTGVDELLGSGRRLEVFTSSRSTIKTVVILDAEGHSRMQLANMLDSDGYQCLLAETFEQAMDMVATRNPGVFILGYHPGMGAVQQLQAIREIHPGTLPLLIADGTDVAMASEVSQRGLAQAILTRPLDAKILHITVREAFELFNTNDENLRIIEELKASSEALMKTNQRLLDRNLPAF